MNKFSVVAIILFFISAQSTKYELENSQSLEYVIFDFRLDPSLVSLIHYVLKYLPYYIQKCSDRQYFDPIGSSIQSCPMDIEEIIDGADQAYKATICVNTTDMVIDVSPALICHF